MIGFIIMLGVTGGIAAAQEMCAKEKQTSELLEQTKNYIESSNLIFNNLQNIDNNVMENTKALSEQSAASAITLKKMQEAYIKSMKKMQLGVALIIVVVFMLLLAKKLKLY